MEIFNFSDYREIVRNWVAERPSKGRGEYQKMAELLGIPASVLSQILSGQRELGADNAFLLGEYMGLLSIERDYFVTLAQVERASHHKFKTYLKTKLKNLKDESANLSKRVSHEKELNEKDQQQFYSSWIYSAIRLRCSFDKGASFDELLQDFRVPKEKMMEIIEFLVRTGLIVHEGSRYLMGPSITFVGRNSPMVVRHHMNWRVKSLERAGDLTKDEMMFTGPLTCSRKDFEKIRERLATAIQEVSDIVKDSPAEELAFFGLDFYKVKL